MTKSGTSSSKPNTISLREVADHVGLPYASSLAGRAFSAAFLADIPIHFAREHAMLGLAGGPAGDASANDVADMNESGPMWVAMSRISDPAGRDLLTRLFRRRILPLLCENDVLQRAINEAYQSRTGQAEQAIAILDAKDVDEAIESLGGRNDLLDAGAAGAPVIRLVNALLFEAVRSLASDVHVQPREDGVVVRIRIDGVLYDSFKLPKASQEEVVSRLKVMGRMNIAEKRLPQDGRATVQVGDKVVDLRIASLPTSHGERIVVRLLDKSARLYRLAELGMPPATLRDFRRHVTAEHGLLLVTGPTGSGKSTTLYAALQELDGVRHNILTLEDPIEYQLAGVSQTQVNEKKGMTFAAGLRNILRQDPDVIMVGEIRDRETAMMAIQSAQTGHLVFSTLHTNDAASAVTRLLDLGIEPHLLAGSLNCVLAQRLVRRVCEACASPATPGPTHLAWLEREGVRFEGTTMRAGRGCGRCRGTGFQGRVGIFELLTFDEGIRQHVSKTASAGELRAAAVRRGMRSLRADGLGKILEGVTVIEEVEHATMQDSDFGDLAMAAAS